MGKFLQKLILAVACFFSLTKKQSEDLPSETTTASAKEKILKWRDLKGQNVAVVGLDLSGSIAAIPTEIRLGYEKLRGTLNQERGGKTIVDYVILYGFNNDLVFLYEGPPKGMPIYGPRHFRLNTNREQDTEPNQKPLKEASLLQYGTALYQAIVITEDLIQQLEQAKSAAIVWLTDGKNTRLPYGDDRPTSTIQVLRRAGIACSIRGIKNEKYISTENLDQILRKLLGSTDPSKTEVLTSEASDSCSIAGKFILGSMADERIIAKDDLTKIVRTTRSTPHLILTTLSKRL